MTGPCAALSGYGEEDWKGERCEEQQVFVPHETGQPAASVGRHERTPIGSMITYNYD
jgi:hypothetical protein